MNSLTATAKLNKVMKMGKKHDLGTIKKDDGTYTNTPRETLELLLKTHFPNKETNNISVTGDPGNNNDHNITNSDNCKMGH